MDQINATMTENELINQTALEPDTGACPAGSETYRVQRGDSFYLIARKFGISVRALMNANPNIAAGHLLVGDILCVPVRRGAFPARWVLLRTPCSRGRALWMSCFLPTFLSGRFGSIT